MDIKIDIEGYQQARQILEQLPVTVQKKMFVVALRSGAKPLIKSARSKAPVKSGLLKKSIRAVRAKSAKKRETAVLVLPVFAQYKKSKKVNAYYGHILHAGTGPRETKKPVVTTIGGRIVNFGTNRGSVAPNPYLLDAYNENKQHMIDGFGNEMAQAITKFVNKNFKPVP